MKHLVQDAPESRKLDCPSEISQAPILASVSPDSPRFNIAALATQVPLTPAAVALRRSLRDRERQFWEEVSGVEDDFDDVTEAFGAIDARLGSKLVPTADDKLAATIENLQDLISGIPILIWPLLFDPDYCDRRVSAIRAQSRLDDLMSDHFAILPKEDRNHLVDVLLAIYLKLLKASEVSHA
jgi:hypothetical protein